MGHRSHRYREDPTVGFIPPTDVYETPDALVAVFELPGVSPTSLSVTLEGDILVVAGDRAESRNDRKLSLLQMEIVYGRFERRISLPSGLIGKDVRAQHQNGVLRVEIPKGTAYGRDEQIVIS